jgi:hypothetical protein
MGGEAKLNTRRRGGLLQKLERAIADRGLSQAVRHSLDRMLVSLRSRTPARSGMRR